MSSQDKLKSALFTILKVLTDNKTGAFDATVTLDTGLDVTLHIEMTSIKQSEPGDTP